MKKIITKVIENFFCNSSYTKVMEKKIAQMYVSIFINKQWDDVNYNFVQHVRTSARQM